MLRPAVVKQPDEAFPITVHFEGRVPIGETAATVAVTARDRVTGTDTTAVICRGGAAVTLEGIASQVVHGGLHGDDHILSWRVTTDPGLYLLEEELQVSVRAQ
jgi:hypothetical protein